MEMNAEIFDKFDNNLHEKISISNTLKDAFGAKWYPRIPSKY